MQGQSDKHERLRRLPKTTMRSLFATIRREQGEKASPDIARIYKGLNQLVKGFLTMCKSSNKDASLKELSKDLANLMDWFRSLSDSETLEQNKSLQDQFQLSKSTMTRFYSVAYHLFAGERYQEAGDALFFLTLLLHLPMVQFLKCLFFHF